jgi:hypothetical protein
MENKDTRAMTPEPPKKATKPARKRKAGPTRKKAPKDPPPTVSERGQRINLITQVLVANKEKGNPRDYVVITHGKQILDASGVYELKAKLPDEMEPESHVWVRGHTNGMEMVVSAIVMEDNVDVDGEPHVLIRDDPKTKEWLLPRADLSPLPLTLTPMVIHKKRLDFYLGAGWAAVFWNAKLNRRRAKPRLKLIQTVKK